MFFHRLTGLSIFVIRTWAPPVGRKSDCDSVDLLCRFLRSCNVQFYPGLGSLASVDLMAHVQHRIYPCYLTRSLRSLSSSLTVRGPSRRN